MATKVVPNFIILHKNNKLTTTQEQDTTERILEHWGEAEAPPAPQRRNKTDSLGG